MAKKNLENINAPEKLEKEEFKAKELPDNLEIVWVSPDSVRMERDNRYTIGFYIVGILVLVLLSIQKMWTGTILVAVGLVMYSVMSQQKPKDIECKVHAEGVVVDGKVYRYEQFKSFWISNGAVPKIKLQLQGFFAGQVEMPILEADEVDKILETISSQLPQENDKGEDIVDTVNRLLRF